MHFNYTPNQDKATPSMMGNVHQGVFLDQSPIFLGGQGGLVGPVRIGFGCLTGAGSIVRKDETRENRIILGGNTRPISLPRRAGGTRERFESLITIFNISPGLLLCMPGMFMYGLYLPLIRCPGN